MCLDTKWMGSAHRYLYCIPCHYQFLFIIWNTTLITFPFPSSYSSHPFFFIGGEEWLGPHGELPSSKQKKKKKVVQKKQKTPKEELTEVPESELLERKNWEWARIYPQNEDIMFTDTKESEGTCRDLYQRITSPCSNFMFSAMQSHNRIWSCDYLYCWIYYYWCTWRTAWNMENKWFHI